MLCVGISHSKSVVTVQRAFRAHYAKDPPTDKTIPSWYKRFTEIGCLYKQKSSSLPLNSQKIVYQIDISLLGPKGPNKEM